MKTRMTFWVDGIVDEAMRDDISSGMPIELGWTAVLQPISDEVAHSEMKAARDAYPFEATVVYHDKGDFFVKVGHSPNNVFGEEDDDGG